MTTLAPVDVLKQWQRLDIPERELARVLGIDVRTLKHWMTGEYFPQHRHVGRLMALSNLYQHLTETFPTPETIRAWLVADNPYLAGMKPIEALYALRPDRVEAALEAIDSGFAV